MYKYFIFIIIVLLNISIYSQDIYIVAKDGSGNFSSIAEVNKANLKAGDLISFKSGQQFSDAILNCKNGVIYSTYGSGPKAIIGDSTSDLSVSETIYVGNENVTLSNLKIYGYANCNDIIKVRANYLNIQECEIIGGQNAHDKRTVGINHSYYNYGTGHKYISNTIKDMGIGIYITYPYNTEIAYNTMYNFYFLDGEMDFGGYGIGGERRNFTTGDTWDCKYTYHVHHNNIYNFEYTAGIGGGSRAVVEYNEIHDNLDERIFRGGVKHGSIGKLFDGYDTESSGSDGGVGLIFRYNFVHDLVRRGQANYTYGKQTKAKVLAKTFDVISTNNGTGQAVYQYSVANSLSDYNGYAPHFGDTPQESPDAVLSGMGYGNYYIHNNLFYNCSNQLQGRSKNDRTAYRNDLGSYFINNTAINCGWLEYITKDRGLLFTAPNSQSSHTVANNIFDYALAAAHYVGLYQEKGLTLRNNIYIKNKNTVISNKNANGHPYIVTQDGDKYAGAFQWNSANDNGTLDNSIIISNEMYNTNPGWINTSLTYFASNIGPSGTFIPDARIIQNGNSYNTGYSFSSLGNDGTGRSFAYDLLGNLRTTNDIGALGASNENNTFTGWTSGLKVFLQAFYSNYNLNTKLSNLKYIPLKQPYNIAPWDFYDNSSISIISNNIVDWLLIELRDDLNKTKYRKTAILNNEGIVLNSDGSNFLFNNIDSGDYYIVINHRNHISIMSSNKINVVSGYPINYDFTVSIDKSYGNNSMVNLGNGNFGMYAGDSDANGIINNLDFGVVARNILTSGYLQGDLDVNGIINVLDYSYINKNILKKSNLP